MSKRFKSQDYFRYPRLGKKWRRPKGRQSKLRKKKGGSGLNVAIGYGTKRTEKNKINGMDFTLVRSLKDLENAKGAIIISGTLGARKTNTVAAKARELGLKIINMKKVRKSESRAKEIAGRKEQKKKKKEEKRAAKPEKKGEIETKKEEQKAENDAKSAAEVSKAAEKEGEGE